MWGSAKARAKAKERRLSKDDAWVDILVAGSSSKRMSNQDAEVRAPGTTPKGAVTRGLTVSGGSGGRSDPELASQEVAQALAAIRQHPPTDDEGEGEEGEGEEAARASPEYEYVADDDEDDDEYLPSPAPKARLKQKQRCR